MNSIRRVPKTRTVPCTPSSAAKHRAIFKEENKEERGRYRDLYLETPEIDLLTGFVTYQKVL